MILVLAITAALAAQLPGDGILDAERLGAPSKQILKTWPTVSDKTADGDVVTYSGATPPFAGLPFDVKLTFFKDRLAEVALSKPILDGAPGDVSRQAAALRRTIQQDQGPGICSPGAETPDSAFWQCSWSDGPRSLVLFYAALPSRDGKDTGSLLKLLLVDTAAAKRMEKAEARRPPRGPD